MARARIEVDAVPDAVERRAWGEVVDRLQAAAPAGPTAPADLQLLGTAAYLCGRDDVSEQAWAQATQRSLEEGDVGRAARCAFWLGVSLLTRMQFATASGWLARATRVLDEAHSDAVERGYLLIPVALQETEQGRHDASIDTWVQAARIGADHGDVDLVTIARQGEGRIRIRAGDVPGGVALLDEAMVAVTAGEVSPIPAGIIYCSVIEACHELFDVRRAREWTEALTAWCEAQPDLVLYRGRCLIHRSEIMVLSGAWTAALREADRARAKLADPPQVQLGAALYQCAELHRLRGDVEAAADAYAEAGRLGLPPQPGLALLRLATGGADAAAVAVRTAVREAPDLPTRLRMLVALVEIALALPDLDEAREAACELAGITDRIDMPYPRAVTAAARGALLLADGDPQAALVPLRAARAIFDELRIPYEAARVGVLCGRACQALGDHEGAALEFDGARRTFDRLGARPDADRLAAIVDPRRPPGGLTDREEQVLRLVGRGCTNREIADTLAISPRTVDRHVSNIFGKLDVPTRAAAIACAYERHLL